MQDELAFKDLNMIDYGLARIIQESAGKEEIAVLFSAGFCIVHGYYSTVAAREMSSRPKIRYLNDDFDAENIAKSMANHEIAELLPLIPFVLYSSKQNTKGGVYFHLLIASNITDETRRYIANSVNDAWKQKAGYDLNFPSKDL